jgi:hypothetical protein
VAVDLHRGDRGPGGQEGQRQGAQPGADLDHPVAGADLGQAGDATHRVRVDDEVLPEGPARVQPVRVEQVGHLATGQAGTEGLDHRGHQIP